MGVVIVALGASLCAQEIPAGTALPVTLNVTLDSGHVKSGEPISAVLEQAVPLPSRAKIRAGSKVTGRVLEAGRKPDGTSYIRIRFDQLQVKKGPTLALTTTLRALASPWEVQDAQLQKRNPIRMESPANITTIQIGGDIVFRGGGHVMHDDQIVGDPVSDGVLARLLSITKCPNGSGDRRLALWLFASTACGAYGLPGLEIEHAGDSNPSGDIVLQSKTGVHVPIGSGLLLLTVEPLR